MDIGKAFSYVFEDESWVSKVLIGGLVSLIPVIGSIVVSGYGYKVAQNVARGVERPLPDWNDFGDALMRGLIGLVISLVYSLPVVLLGIVFAVVTAGAAAASRGERGGAAVAGLSVCLIPLILILGLICGAASLSAIARYLATDDFGQAFKFGEVFANLRNHIGVWVMLLLVAILAGLVASLGLIACGVGVLFTGFYAQAVIGHALGQTMRQLGLGQYAAPPTSYGAPPTYS
jgi:hypothetical protein